MKRSAWPALAAVFLSGLPAVPTHAHTSVTSTSPESGAVLDDSPPVVEIRFRDVASLTSVVVLEAGKPERELEFAPKGKAASFKLPNPGLAPGRNVIRWKALSKDGHVISGSLILVIAAPAAAKTR